MSSLDGLPDAINTEFVSLVWHLLGLALILTHSTPIDFRVDIAYRFTLKNSPEQNRDVRLAMLPCAHIQGHSNAGEVGEDPTHSPVPPPASETPRYCAGASLQRRRNTMVHVWFKSFFGSIFYIGN